MDTRGQATGRGGWRRRPKGPGMCVAELDFAALTPWQRQVVYCTLARHAGVDPGQRPFGVLSLGDRRVLYAVPGLVADTLWLDPLSLVFLASGVPAPGAPVVATLSVPAVSTTLGFRFVWQGLTFDGTAGLQIGNPEYTIVH